MATVSTNEFKGGLKLMLDNEPCVILETNTLNQVKAKRSTALKFVNFFLVKC